MVYFHSFTLTTKEILRFPQFTNFLGWELFSAGKENFVDCGALSLSLPHSLSLEFPPPQTLYNPARGGGKPQWISQSKLFSLGFCVDI